MNDVYSYDFSKTAPEFLKCDTKVLALIKAVSNQVTKLMNASRKVLIFCNIDELSEDALDVLAYDLHIEWYDNNFDVEQKKTVIKDSIVVHSKLGTLKSVVSAVKAVLPNATVENWFEYGGLPKRFKINSENATVTQEQIDKVFKDIAYIKKLSTYLEKIVLSTVSETQEIYTGAFIHQGEVRALKLHDNNTNYPFMVFANDELIIATDDNVNVATDNGFLNIEAPVHLVAENGYIYLETEE